MSAPALLDPGLPEQFPPDRHLYPWPKGIFILVIPTLVPRSLAVICYDNALRLITIDDEAARPVDVARDYLPVVAGGEMAAVEPPPSAQEIAYLQSRRLVLFDLERRRHRAFRITDNMEEVAVAGAWASLSPRSVVVQLEDTSRYDEEGRADARLRAYAIDGSEAAPRGTIELEQDAPKELDWGAGRGAIAVARRGLLDVFDAALTAPVAHPLARPLAALLGASPARRLHGIRFHPGLNMAVVAVLDRDRSGARDFSVFLATWGGGEDARIAPLARVVGAGTMRLGALSPDDGWASYSVSVEGVTRFFVQRVAGEPEPPVPLGAFASPRAACWTRDPLSFVVLDDDLEVICSYRLDRLRSPPP